MSCYVRARFPLNSFRGDTFQEGEDKPMPTNNHSFVRWPRILAAIAIVLAISVSTVAAYAGIPTPSSSPHKGPGGTIPGGTYTVGVGGNYATLTAAIADYNAGPITGPVVFQLTDANYPSETFPIQIENNTGAGATNTLTIKPAPGVQPTITGSNGNGLLVLNGATYIIIDGSNTVGGSSQDLTISNTTTNGPTIRLQGTATSGASNNIIENCVLTDVGAALNTSAVINIYLANSQPLGHNNNTIQKTNIVGGGDVN